MANFLLVAGPPASSALWKDVANRIQALGHTAHAIDLFTSTPSDATCTHTLTQAIDACDGPVFVIAHGAATATARHAASITPPTGLILTNGPLTALPMAYRMASALTRAPVPAGRRGLLLRLLSSSAGLRRTVSNPYVWDHDTVVRVCGPLLADHDTSGRVRRFLSDLPRSIATAPAPTVPTRLIWGDADPFFTRSKADSFTSNFPACSLDTITGGQHFHPLERPWEIAEKSVSWAQQHPTTT